MSAPQSDALVFFGATGDLAYKKIFPALQAMARRGHLAFPVIGVAKSGWTLDQLRERARDSVEKHGGVDEKAFAELARRLRYVDGDYKDAETYKLLRQELDGAERPGALPRHPAESVRHRRAGSGASQTARPTRASSSRSPSDATCPRRGS